MSERRNQYDQPVGPAVDKWTERARPPRHALPGRYCRLEPVDAQRHAADLFAAYMDAPDARDWTYLFHERPETLTLFEEYLTGLAKSDDPLHYTIVDTEATKPVGTAALMRIDSVQWRHRGRLHCLFAAHEAHARRYGGDVPVDAAGLRRSRLPTLRMEVR